MSLSDLVKEINYVMNNRRQKYYVIPDSRDLIAQYLLIYEMSGGDTLSDWVDLNYQKLRLSVQLDSTRSLEEHVDQTLAKAQELFPPGAKITIVGDVPIMIRLTNLLTEGQVKSILVAFISIGILMIIVLRSVKAGLISMIPNIFPIAVIGGLMGILKIDLDMITVMVAPMIIGIAVDDTVHFFIHFKEEVELTGSYSQANIRTFEKICHALLFTSIVLTLGFGIFGFSNVAGLLNMGMLAATGIVSALAADYFIGPVLLFLTKPFKSQNSYAASREKIRL